MNNYEKSLESLPRSTRATQHSPTKASGGVGTYGGRLLTIKHTLNRTKKKDLSCSIVALVLFFLGLGMPGTAQQMDLTGADTNHNNYIDDEELLIIIDYWAQRRPIQPEPPGEPEPPGSIVPLTLPADAKPLEIIPIPAGTFMMGSPSGEKDRGSDETQHQVTLVKPFNIGQYEITQAQYKEMMGSNPSHFSGKANNPVEPVSWYDCARFCNCLSEIAGLPPVYDETTWEANGFPLPTSAEWE